MAQEVNLLKTRILVDENYSRVPTNIVQITFKFINTNNDGLRLAILKLLPDSMRRSMREVERPENYAISLASAFVKELLKKGQ